MPKYIVNWPRHQILQLVVEADDEDAALKMLRDGDLDDRRPKVVEEEDFPEDAEAEKIIWKGR